MNASLEFTCGLAITLITAFLVVRYLHDPLRTQLSELCGNAGRAEFWTAFSTVTVILTSVIFAMLADPTTGAGMPPLLVITNQLRWGLIGLVVSVLILGWILSRFIPKTVIARPAGTTPHPGEAL